MALGARSQRAVLPRRRGLLVSEIEQIKQQLIREQRLRFEAERDQAFTFVLLFALGFFAGVGVTWWSTL
jgi:hypothetical protein